MRIDLEREDRPALTSKVQVSPVSCQRHAAVEALEDSEAVARAGARGADLRPR